MRLKLVVEVDRVDGKNCSVDLVTEILSEDLPGWDFWIEHENGSDTHYRIDSIEPL